MMDPESFRALTRLAGVLVSGATFVFLAYSPVARALGNRIVHGKLPADEGRDDERIDHISGEVAAMRHNLNEALERLDFTERMLTQARERGQLGTGKDD